MSFWQSKEPVQRGARQRDTVPEVKSGKKIEKFFCRVKGEDLASVDTLKRCNAH